MARLLVLLVLVPIGAFAQPELRLSPDTLRLGEVPVGAEVSGEFVLIESVGDEPITIKIHAAFQPFFMPFDRRYRLDPVEDGLIDSRPAVLGLVPVRTGPHSTDVAVDTDERGAYIVQARATGVDPVAFTLAPGETANRTLEIRNPGYVRLDVRTEAAAPWAALSPAFFSLAPDEGQPVTLTLNTAGLAPGVYRDTLRAMNDGTPNAFDWRVPVELTITGVTGSSPEPLGSHASLLILSTPARDTIRLRYAGVHSPGALRVYDARGREMARLGTVAGDGVLDWSPPSPGLYFVHLGTEAGGLTRSVVVAR